MKKQQLFSLGAILAVTAIGSNISFDANELGLSGGEHSIEFKTLEDLNDFYNLSVEEQAKELNYEATGINLLISDSSGEFSDLYVDANYNDLTAGEATLTFSAYTDAGIDNEEVEITYDNNSMVSGNEDAQFIGGVDTIVINTKEDLQNFYDMDAIEQLHTFGITSSGMSLVTSDSKSGELSDLYVDALYNGLTEGSADLNFIGYGNDGSYNEKTVTVEYKL